MKATHVALRATPDSLKANRPSLTPELLAATGARYSRSSEGLDAILSRIDPDNLDKSVDSIFRMIDYGHQSIADMAPVAIFIDGISLYLAYFVWSLCPTAGGQESSTRYINYAQAETIAPELLGIPSELRDEWQASVQTSYRAYADALTLWENIATQNPDLVRIPRELRDDSSDKSSKQVARMKRNYAFDRARVFLPVCAPTNMMMVMSARGWVGLCNVLLSHPNPEAQMLGEALREELPFAAPRLLKHAVATETTREGLRQEFETVRQFAQSAAHEYLKEDAATFEHPPTAFLDATPPRELEKMFAADLRSHQNRYAWIGSSLRRTSLRFGWEAVALAEIRDLNRHRTGTKWCPLAPRGFYTSMDQLPPQSDVASQLRDMSTHGRAVSARALELLRDGDTSYIHWTLLGTQYLFEHTTTADKFIYEAELRTGSGAHFRYARHLHDALALWHERFPQTRGLILEGEAEPE